MSHRSFCIGGLFGLFLVGLLSLQGHAQVGGGGGVIGGGGGTGMVVGGSCTNQVTTAISVTGVPTCTTVTSAYVDTSVALTGADINTSNQVTVTHLVAPLPVAQGGTALASGTSGGILGFTASGVIASSGSLTANALVLGGGAGATPTVLGSLGSTTTVLHGNGAGAPTFGAVALGTDISGQLPLGNGGTNANLVASNGGIFYSTGSAGAILAGTATATQMLQSGANTTPAWSTSTWPATTTINQVLYSSAANTVGGLATGNNGTLITSAGGVPSISSTLPNAVQLNITALGTVTTGTIPLSNLAAAASTNTIANGDNPQTWNWAMTTAGRIGMTLGETSAATSTGTPYLAKFTTLIGSTATPLNVANSLNGSQTLPALAITPTWNTTGVATALDVNVTNTASGAGSKLMTLRVGGTSEFAVDKAGTMTFGADNITITDGGASVISFSTQTVEGGAFTDLPSLTMALEQNTLAIANTGLIKFSSTGVFSGSPDLGLFRNAVGVLEVNNGTSGTYRDLKYRSAIIGGTVPGISGCTAGTQTGGATAGTFASGTTGTCTVVLTFAFTAPTGWYCNASDRTTITDTMRQTNSANNTTTKCELSGTTASGDVIGWSATAY